MQCNTKQSKVPNFSGCFKHQNVIDPNDPLIDLTVKSMKIIGTKWSYFDILFQLFYESCFKLTNILHAKFSFLILYSLVDFLYDSFSFRFLIYLTWYNWSTFKLLWHFMCWWWCDGLTLKKLNFRFTIHNKH